MMVQRACAGVEWSERGRNDDNRVKMFHKHFAKRIFRVDVWGKVGRGQIVLVGSKHVTLLTNIPFSLKKALISQ